MLLSRLIIGIQVSRPPSNLGAQHAVRISKDNILADETMLTVCLLQRWTFPFVPDTNLLPLSGSQGVSSYTMSLSRLEVIYK